MATYSVEGKLGTGKTKFCVWQIQQALRKGLRVATNLDLHLEFLVPDLPKASYQRIPDKPTSADLHAIGHGNPDSYDEDKNGLLVLDELGSWLNTRSFQDKDRLPVIDWLIHARKKGWHVYFIVQDSRMIDKQVREALIEYKCNCIRLDKVKIPFGIGSLLGTFHRKLAYLPRAHYVAARVGEGAASIVAERWTYRGDDLHAAYDTRQIFRHDPDACTYSVLHPKRFAVEQRSVPWLLRLLAWCRPGVARPPVKEPLPLVQLVATLPPDQRVRHIRRLIALGAV